MPPPLRSETTVVKRMQPHQAGALKLARRYGDALICVRYRRNVEGTRRYTTVELIVAQGPTGSTRARLDATVFVKLDYDDAERRRQVSESGATWNAKRQLWRMTRRTARTLGLVDRIMNR
jgi:hypothetical protein